jgi:hypothetical protein
MGNTREIPEEFYLFPLVAFDEIYIFIAPNI